MLDAARVTVLLAAAALPFSTTATSVFMGLALLCWALSGQLQPTLRAIAAEPAAWLGFVLLAALCAGVAWSRVPPKEAFAAVLKYRELALFSIVMFLFADERWRARLLWTIFIAAIALMAASHAIFLGLVRNVVPAVEHNAVLLKSPITHGFMMSLLAYGAAALALAGTGWRRWVMAAVALSAVLNTLLAVQGRTGYVVLAALAVWLAVSQRSVKAVAVVLLGLAIAVGAAYRWAPAFQARIDQTATEAIENRTDRETSIAMRLHYLKRSVELVRKDPLLGAGTGAWSDAFYEATVNDPPLFHDRRHYHPHNEYLYLAVQLGLGGLVLLVALFGAAFWRAGALPDKEALLARGFVLAFAMGCLLNDFLWDSTEGHLWAVLGGALFGASAPRPPLQARH
ncbi:MAG TPA: O-antigen ligase family protein [Burkholderiales bacterium]|nr:O-antigen ligase family protein [Burkholderiales bacterium]